MGSRLKRQGLEQQQTSGQSPVKQHARHDAADLRHPSKLTASSPAVAGYAMATHAGARVKANA